MSATTEQSGAPRRFARSTSDSRKPPWRTCAAGSPRWVEASDPNVVYFNEVDEGGHFAAWEEPEVFSEEMRAAFRSLR